uniref:N-acetyltransferase domain-containing protein n=1 Tax=Archaeoglobus fulgidus TaxID=2234 RepID=A0A7J2TIS8_ARCFL
MEARIEGAVVLYDGGKRVSEVRFVAGFDEIEILETVTAEGEKGKGYASMVVEKAIQFAGNFKKIRISCPYVKRWIEKKGLDAKFEFTRVLHFKEAVEKFNRYRSPEAKAKILEISDEKAVVEISGPFCVSCGIFDYFEDIAVEANAKVADYRESENGFLVTYVLK